MKKRQNLVQKIALALCLLILLNINSIALGETLTATVNADKVFFRTKANTSSDYYAKLNKGSKVALLGEASEFYKVRFDSKTGYIMKSFVTVPGSTLKKLSDIIKPKSTSKYANTTSIKNLGDPPKMSKIGDKGEHVEKLQRALQLKKCYTGIVDGSFGKLTQEAVKVYQKKYKLDVTGQCDYKTTMKLFGKVTETSPANDPQMAGISKISQIKTPNTTKKGNRGAHVRALQQALKLKGYYKAAIDSSYGDDTLQAVTAFQKSNRLTADGIAGNATIKKLFGQDAANHTIPTQKLDWFKDGVRTIPKGATFSVKDVSTGKTFSAVRWSGANHLDAEPASASDTKVVKEVFGGDWSWARRSILVRYNGQVYAASMNGMPHGTTVVDNNNFSGHFCIHFYNSRTHDTNRVDQTHQNAVGIAMRASW
ncbi:MAG: hypothetical protein GX781_06865 [Clostridiales bacterium]|nr:hypothetical protein [Clostridiales bacterium]